MNTDSPITSIKGIGDKTAKIYEKLGVYRLNDMLLFFPRDYCLYPEAVDISAVDREAVFAVRVKVNRRVELKKFRTGVIACALFGGGLECVWFNGNYIPNVLHLGYDAALYGDVAGEAGILVRAGRKRVEDNFLVLGRVLLCREYDLAVHD